jgi:hypothetical protein
MPVVKFSSRLDSEQKCSFLDRHFLTIINGENTGFQIIIEWALDYRA